MDKGFAKLSPKAAVLFLLMLPRLNAHGKMDGDVYSIKGLCCRHIDYISIKELPGLLQEISGSTSVKWWEDSSGNAWVHATNYAKYNRGLRTNRMGKDKLPSYQNAFTPGVLPVEVEVEVEGEVEGEEYTPPIPPCGGVHKRSEKVSEDFSTFWLAYPKRVGKKQAWAAWQSLGADRPPLGVLLAAVDAARRGRAWRDGYIPQPMRWLRDRRWEDEIQPCPLTNAQQAASVGATQPTGASDAAAESLTLMRQAEALGLSVPLWATDDEIRAEIERAKSGGLDSP